MCGHRIKAFKSRARQTKALVERRKRRHSCRHETRLEIHPRHHPRGRSSGWAAGSMILFPRRGPGSVPLGKGRLAASAASADKQTMRQKAQRMRRGTSPKAPPTWPRAQPMLRPPQPRKPPGPSPAFRQAALRPGASAALSLRTARPIVVLLLTHCARARDSVPAPASILRMWRIVRPRYSSPAAGRSGTARSTTSSLARSASRKGGRADAGTGLSLSSI